MTFEAAAAELARQLRANSAGFLTLSKDDLRRRFQIGRLTPNLSQSIVEALESVEIFAFPHPIDMDQNLRVYDRRTDLGKAAMAIAAPDEVTDAPLRRIGETLAREKAGRDLRSDDVPWLEGFGMLLELVLGREPDHWEDLRNDRHSSGLARALAEALGIDVELVGSPAIIRLAAAAGMFRPTERRYRADELATDAESAAHAGIVAQAIELAEKRVVEQRTALLKTMAVLVLRGDEPPKEPIEVGLLGLRRRRELGV